MVRENFKGREERALLTAPFLAMLRIRQECAGKICMLCPDLHDYLHANYGPSTTPPPLPFQNESP